MTDRPPKITDTDFEVIKGLDDPDRLERDAVYRELWERIQVEAKRRKTHPPQNWWSRFCYGDLWAGAADLLGMDWPAVRRMGILLAICVGLITLATWFEGLRGGTVYRAWLDWLPD